MIIPWNIPEKNVPVQIQERQENYRFINKENKSGNEMTCL